MKAREISEPKAGRYIITSSRGEKISAVEGLYLSKRMSGILREGADRGLCGDERRALIRDELSAKK